MKNLNLKKLMEYGMDTGQLSGVHDFVNADGAAISPTLLEFLRDAGSGIENLWSNGIGKILIESETNNRVIFTGYEWYTFKLPGGSYTPDYNYLMENGLWVMVEIKHGKHQPNYRDARSKLRAAAALNPWFVFYECRCEGGNWVLERIYPDKGYVKQLLGEANGHGKNDSKTQ
jgi:hypothetical protein